MKVGTKSVLFGAHAFWLHPWFVAAAWIKLYGFPWRPWVWIAFFVHDIGYWGCSNMDDEEGEQHPWRGARILWKLEEFWLFLHQPVFYERRAMTRPIRWWMLRRRLYEAGLTARYKWGNEALYHSRWLALKYGVNPSNLCWADKLATALIPWWIYLPLTSLTGEIREYIHRTKNHDDLRSTHGEGGWSSESWREKRRWFKDCQAHMRRVAGSQVHAQRA